MTKALEPIKSALPGSEKAHIAPATRKPMTFVPAAPISTLRRPLLPLPVFFGLDAGEMVGVLQPRYIVIRAG